MFSPERSVWPNTRLWALAGSISLHGLSVAALLWAAPWDGGAPAAPVASTDQAIEVTLVSDTRAAAGSAARQVSDPPSRADARSVKLAEAASPALVSPVKAGAGGEAQPRAPDGGAGASGGPPAAAIDPTVGADYRRRLLAHIQPFRRYPLQSVDAKGVVQLIFMVDQGGGVMGVWVKSSSGFEVLDAEAVATIMRAQPMPRVPPGLPSPLTVQLPVSFSPS